MRLLTPKKVHIPLIETCLIPLLDMALCFLVVFMLLFFLSFNTNNTGVVLGKTNSSDGSSDVIITIDATGKIYRYDAEITVEELSELTKKEAETRVKVRVAADATCAHIMPILIELMGCDWAASVELETECG